MRFGRGLRPEHYLLISPAWLPNAGSKFSAKDYAESLAESGANCVEFYVKDHHGVSFYDTNVGVRCPSMKGDYLAELCEETAKHGIEVMAYFSVGFDMHCARQEPTWRMVTAKGEPVRAGLWYYMCLNSPYRDYMFAQVSEIAKYPVTAFWHDILRFPELFRGGCFCNACRRKYRWSTGRDAPDGLDPLNPASRDYIRFQQNSVTSFLAELRAAGDDKPMTFNGAGFLTPAEWNQYVDWFNVEGHGPEYLDQSFKCRYLGSFDKSWEILTPGNNKGWTSFSAKPVDATQLECDVAIGQGGLMTFGVLPDADGDAMKPESTIASQRPRLKALNVRHKELHKWIDNGRPLANVSILHTLATHGAMIGGHPSPGLDQDISRALRVGQPLEAYPREVILEARGFHSALYDRGVQFRVINEYALNHLDTSDAVIVGEQRYLPDDVIDALKKMAERGGTVILTGQTTLFDADGRRMTDFALADFAGVNWMDVSNYSMNYAYPLSEALSAGTDEYRIPFAAPLQVVRPQEGTEVLARVIPPESERTEQRFFFHEQSGPDMETPVRPPLVTRRRVGKGQVIYVAAPLGRDFEVRRDSSVGQLVRNLVKLAAPQVLETKAGIGLEISVTKHEAGHVLVHLVNHYSNRVESFVPARKAHEVDISIDTAWLEKALGGSVGKARLVPEDRDVAVKTDGGRLSFVVDEVGISAIVALERA